jgi:hypothetical protein
MDPEQFYDCMDSLWFGQPKRPHGAFDEYLSDKITDKSVDEGVRKFHDVLWDEDDRMFVECCDEIAGDPLPDSVAEDTGGVDIGVDEVTGPGVGRAKTKRRVRRGGNGRLRFVRHWVDWGKTRFPTVAGSQRAADRDCVARALVREMENLHVRYSDIAKYKDRILLGIMMPSTYEVSAAKAYATEAARAWQTAGEGWRWRGTRTWWDWICGRPNRAYAGAVYRSTP